ncbi:outer membrane protein [Mucilaginibacter gracilis]|uniref:Outer membrane protein n=1 Tax=Mucilaginibacter gracilis TaxID=423350 RepID=A0A495J1J2_9SPHI|nr:TolC family protein [Mucilaginibacter gracilis]RKR82184.1 outer membrane protein [Mucilaginibacter gracilis]
MNMNLNIQLNSNKVFLTIVLGLLLLSSAFKAGAQEVITLQTAIDRTLERNLTIKQAQLNEAIDVENYKQAKYNRLPNLSANPQGSFNYGRSVDPSTNQFVNQTIFGLNGTITSQVLLSQGGLLKNQILANKLQLDVDKSNTAKVKNDLVLNVVTTYLSVLSNQDLLKAAIQQVELSKQTLDKVQKTFDVGNVTLADLSQSKAQVSTADLNQTTAQNQLDISILALKQYMEMDPNTPITIEKPDVSKLTDVKWQYDAQSVFSAAVGNNPDVKLAEVQKQLAYQNIAVQKSYYYPTLSLFGQLGSNYSSGRTQVTGTRNTGIFDTIGIVNNTNNRVITPRYQTLTKPYLFGDQISDNLNEAVGLSLNIPIFTKFATRTSVRKAKINYQIADVTAQLAKNTLNKTISQAVLDVKAADKKYLSAQQTYQSNKDAYNVVQQRYTVGLVNSLDYNTSLTTLNKSEFDMIQAKYELVFRSKIIDYYLGNPITL